MRSSVDRDNNICHYVTLRKAASQLRYVIIRQDCGRLVVLVFFNYYYLAILLLLLLLLLL
jgi:hypothetical protein